MLLEKSLLTDILLFAGIALVFLISYFKRKNFIFSLFMAWFYVGCYLLFFNCILPFPLDFKPIDIMADLDNQVVMMTWKYLKEDIQAFLPEFIAFFSLGITVPVLFPKCRKLCFTFWWGLIPAGILLFQFIMNIAIGGIYKYIHFLLLAVFFIAFYTGYAIVKLAARKNANLYDAADRGMERSKTQDYDNIL